MLRVHITLVPHGDEMRARSLGSIDIINDGMGTPFLGSYKIVRRSARGRILDKGNIGEFKRKRHGPWKLLAGVLMALFPNALTNAWRGGSPRSYIW